MTGHFGELVDGVAATAAWNQFWQVSVLAAIVAVVVRLTCRQRPHLAHTLWLLVLVKCLTPPIWSSEISVFSQLTARLNSIEPSASAPQHGGESATVDAPPSDGRENMGNRLVAEFQPEPLAVEQLIVEVTTPHDAHVREGEAPAEPLPATVTSARQEPRPPGDAPQPSAAWGVPQILGSAWCAGFVICSLLIVIRRFACAVVLRRSQLEFDSKLETMLASVSEQLGIRRHVRLVVTSRGIGPAIFGVLRPVIVLPQRVLEDRSSDQLQTILAHELLHLRRGDTFIGLVQVCAQAVWWFHPLVWWANRQIVRERERCCDDEVVAGLGCEPADYAQTLLDVLKSSRRLQAIPGVPGIRPIELTKRRLEHIMTAGRRHGRNPLRHWLLLLTLTALFVPGAALSFPDNDKAAKPAPVTLQLGADNKVHVLGRRIAPDNLKPILKQVLNLARDGEEMPAVRIVAHEDSLHESVVKLLDVCQELGFTEIALSVQREAVSEQEKPTGPSATATRATQTSTSREFAGHGGKVNAVAWSRDKQVIASGGAGGELRLWEAGTGKQLSSLQLPHGTIWSIVFSPDGRRVVCGCNNGIVQVCSVAPDTDVATLETPYLLRQIMTLEASKYQVWSVTVSPDSQFIAVGTKDARVQVWNAATGARVFESNNASQVSGIRYTPDGSMLATSSVNEPVKLWNAKTGELVRTFEKAPTFQQWVAVSPNGELVATASWDGSSLLWDANSGKLLHTFPAPAPTGSEFRKTFPLQERLVPARRHLNYVTFSPDGKLLASAGADGRIRLWGVEQRESWGVLDAHSASAMSLAFSPDGKELASAGEDRRVHVWSVPAQPVGQSAPAAVAPKQGRSLGSLRKWLGRDGGGLIGSGSVARGRTVWPHWPSTNGVLQTQSSSGDVLTLETVLPRGRIVSLDWSPDGDRIAFVDAGSVRIYEVPSFKLIRILTGHSVRNWGRPLAWSPDGKTLATGGYDGTVRYWSADGVPGPVMQAHKNPVASVRWSPSGDRLASVGYYGGIRTWNKDGTANTTVAANTHWLSSVSWSPDGTRLVVGELHRDASIWNATGGRVATLPFGAHVQTVAWHPEGDVVAIAGGRNEIDLWTPEGKKLKTLTGHKEHVASLDWSIGGDQLASGAWDDTVRLWSKDGEPEGLLTGHEDAVVSVAWSPDGVWLASGDSNDSTLRIWTAEGGAGPVLHGHRDYTTEMKWSPDGKHVAVGGRGSDRNGRVNIWTSEGEQAPPMTRHRAGAIEGIAWSPDSLRVATSGGDNAANIWTANGEHAGQVFGFKQWVNDIAWSADGTWVVTAGIDGAARFFNVEGQPRADGVGVEDGPDEIVDVAWNPTSGVLASASQKGVVSLWKPDGSRLLPRLATFQYDGDINDIAWNRQGNQLVVAGTAGVRFLKADCSPGPAAEGPSLNATSPHWNASGQLLVADRGGSNLVQIWSADGRGHNVARGWGFRLGSPRWSPAGDQFVSGGSDKAVYVFNPDGTTKTVAMGHHDTVNHVTWSPTADVLVSVANDNTIRCWNPDSGKQVWVGVSLRGHRTITFSRNGKVIGGDPDIADDEFVFVQTTDEGSRMSTPSAAGLQ